MISKFNPKYDKIISILNSILADTKQMSYFQFKLAYIPLIVVRTYEPRIDVYEDQPNLLIEDDLSYKIQIKNTPLNQGSKRKLIIKSKYSFNINTLQEEELSQYLKKHNIFTKSMHTYMNGYYETYLMIYLTNQFKKFEFEKNFNFLMLYNPIEKKNASDKCIIS